MTITIAATSITLPWPPTVNGYWQAFAIGGGRVVMSLTKRARLYRSDVATAIRLKFGAAKLVPYSTPVRIDVELRAPDRRARDLDNHLKGLFDALTHAGVWDDDVLVDEMTVRRGPLIACGCVKVLIAALDAQPDLIPSAPHDP